MPTNVTPEYKKAKEQFQKAREPAERLTWLREMLRTVPKHKGTEHLQADIKTRIKQITDELAGPKKGGAKTGPVHTVRPEGAAQIALIGPPNSGKSSLHQRLTGSHAEIGPYLHTTRSPLPGMFPFEDIQFQVVDLPPVSATYMEAWMPNALQPAHAALVVVDLSVPGCVENVAAIKERLDQKRVSLVDRWPGVMDHDYLDVAGQTPSPVTTVTNGDVVETFESDDPFRTNLPALLVANKSDLEWSRDEISLLEELIGVRYPALAVSALTGRGLDRIGPLLFQGLGIVRVYTKIPGRPADTSRPFTVFQGNTVFDVAQLVHRDVAKSLKFARVWGSAKYQGQRVGKDHVLSDGDVLELHA